MNSRQIVINDQLLHFYHGAGEGPDVLLFLHGWRSDSTAWFLLLKELQKISGSEIIALDLPGFGRSEMPKKDFTLTDYCYTVEQFIEKQSLKNPVLVGHSFGGRIVIKLAAENSTHYPRVILVDSAGIKPKPKKSLNILAKAVKPFFTPSWMQPLRRKIYHHLGAEDYVATPRLQATYMRVIQEDLTPLLKKIIADTLLIWGEKDNDTPLRDGQAMQQAIKRSELHIIKNAGHYPFREQPKEVAQHIQSFLVKS